MKAPATPADEQARLETLRKYQILDTLPEQALEDVTALVAQICDVPICMISLVDEDRQWFKSKIGMTVEETARDISFCGHTILEPGLFIVNDTATDERFADNPMVTGELGVRFYGGAPLTTASGHAIGALCVMDRVPRELTPSQQEVLRDRKSTR